jgi:signal transduction histidine kinase
MVHDLRNPLTTIQGSAEMLVSSSLSGPQIHRLARNMYGATIRMKELLDEIFSLCGATEKESIGLCELVEGAVNKITLIAESQSVRIVQNVEDNLVVSADRQRIQRVLVNLLVNALEALPNGGTIQISAVLAGKSALITVHDTGPGISTEIRSRLFQPFATGKPNGLGLGLALSRQTVIDHGGDMWLEPSGQGACFAVRLPRVAKQCCAASC